MKVKFRTKALSSEDSGPVLSEALMHGVCPEVEESITFLPYTSTLRLEGSGIREIYTERLKNIPLQLVK